MGAIVLMIIFPFMFLGLAFSSHDDDDEPEEIPASTQDADLFQGSAGDDLYFAGAGQDTVMGGAGNDRLHGQQDDDTLFGGGGQDSLYGDGGDDVLWLGEGGDGATPPLGDDANAELRELLFSGDTLALESFFAVNADAGGGGGQGNDYINGGAGDDVLSGGECDDTLRGSSGHDFLVDLQGANTLNGGYGDDELWALDPGNTNAPDLLQGWDGDDLLLGNDGDTMEGGAGEDGFLATWVSGSDPVTVTDLDPAAERLMIITNLLPAGSVLALADHGADIGTDVVLNGETIAVLSGLTAAQVLANSGSVVVMTNNGNLLYAA